MSNLLDGNLTNLPTPKEFSHTLIITVGSGFRADDGVGPYIASGLKPSSKFSVLEGGYTPEDIIDDAVQLGPQVIIFIDAADFAGKAGELRLIDAEHIPQSSLSTHSMPLSVISRILQEDTKAVIHFIGIQPKSVEHKEGLSKEVKASADALVKHINERFKDA